MRIVFSWDDGAVEDRKMFELHEKYELPGMFFVPTYNCEGRDVISPDVIKRAESKYVAFGGHTENHKYLTDIPLEQVEREVSDNQIYLQNVLGHGIDDFCLPGGRYNEDILDIVYKYYKTVRTADTMNFKMSGTLYKPAFHVYPRGLKSLVGNAIRHGSYKELAYVISHFRKEYFELLREMINKDADSDKTVIIWGHSWEIEKLGLWEKLEDLMFFLNKEYKNNCVAYSTLHSKDRV